ncbi:MAG TPA: tyrosine-type recombinase/integrase [Rhodoferax sp.]|nr:tyrosine-type recombinase/integrase [Rhodoferax sp.]
MKQGKAPYIGLAELAATLAAQTGIHATRNQSILMLSHYMGLRAMELAKLTIGDLYDPQTREVRESVRLLSCMTKGQKFREVYLTHVPSRQILATYLASRGLRYMDAPLFLSQRGGAFSPNTMQRLLAIMYQRAGVVGSSHSGRRSFATHLIETGADVFAIKELLGHTSIATTQRYFSSNPSRMKKFVSLLI